MARGAREKRARHPRACDYTKAFGKDWARLAGSGRHDMHRLEIGHAAPDRQRRTARAGMEGSSPKGEWARHREGHAGGDTLLIHRTDDAAGEGGTIVFVRIGTHADLFGG